MPRNRYSLADVFRVFILLGTLFAAIANFWHGGYSVAQVAICGLGIGFNRTPPWAAAGGSSRLFRIYLSLESIGMAAAGTVCAIALTEAFFGGSFGLPGRTRTMFGDVILPFLGACASLKVPLARRLF